MPKKPSKKSKRVVVAMSGGVDSSVAAYLLKKQGYDVVGIFLKFWAPDYYAVGANGCSPDKKGICHAPLRYEIKKEKENACCNLASLNIARQIAERLDIPFYVIHVEEYFKKEIVDNFISQYEKGLTPNPCVRCNRAIKFGFLWEKAMALGADYLATGHYVKTGQFQRKGGKITNYELQITNKSQIPNNKKAKNINFEHCDLGFVCDLDLGACDFCLLRGKDIAKDQTYFLSQIDARVIPHLLFPLGDLVKSEVRAIAKRAKLPVYNKRDSMGVCFIPDGDNANFLAHYSKKLAKKGEVVDKAGNVFGKHNGLIGYTIGEKIGRDDIAAKYIVGAHCHAPDKGGVCNTPLQNSDVPRLYIIAIDPKKNRLIIGENEDCFSNTLIAKDLNIINPRFWEMVEKKEKMFFQIRGGHRAEEGKIVKLSNCQIVGENKKISRKDSNLAIYQFSNKKCSKELNTFKFSKDKLQNMKITVKFSSPVRAITPGQTVAFYVGDVLLGGGIIK